MSSKPPPADQYLTQAVAAVLCDVTPLTMTNWDKQPNPPPRDPMTGLYPARALGRWMRSEQLFKTGRGGGFPFMPDMSRASGIPSSVAGGGDDQPTTKLNEEIRLIKARADKAEIEVAEKAGQLIPVEEVSSAWTKLVMRVKTRLLKLPTTIAPMVHGMPDVHDVQAEIERGVREALEELSRDWQDADDDENPEAG